MKKKILLVGGGGFIVDELNNIFTDFLNKNLN